VTDRQRKPTTTAEDWQRRYELADTPWDSGRVDPELRRLIEAGDSTMPARGARVLELGCGTGTNAIYLAEQGFDVTAVDVAPRAIELAQARAAMKVVATPPRFVLADVVKLDDDLLSEVAQIDLVFDRGCYHCVRRAGLLGGYLATVRRLTVSGSRLLILAGNPDAGEPGGPPKVTAAELMADFEKLCRIDRLAAVRFEEADGSEGPLGWSLLMTRR